jgi:transglutaminase-like putative cysteine protease
MSRLLPVLYFLCHFMAPALAQQTEPVEESTRMELYAADYVLNDDASHAVTRTMAMQVLKESAVAESKRRSISYSTSMETVEVIEAYTRKPDGRRIDVPATNFQVERNSGRDKDAPVFSDETVLTLVFPDVAALDTLVLTYRATQIEAIFPGRFSVIEYYPRTYGYGKVRVRVDAPAHLPVKFQQQELTVAQDLIDGGRRIVEWTMENPVARRPDRTVGAIFNYEKHPGFAYSTFPDHAAIALAYGERATPKAAVTPRIKALADEISGKEASARDQVRVLYDWVATKISYAGNCVGVGAVVPHDLDFVLDNRMGDCKDHATLLQALLAARGIDSVQALVNASSVYALPRVPVVSTVNHVINYVPSLDMYLDSTASDTPFGMLPFAAADKPVLLVDGSRPGARTPKVQHGANRQRMKTHLKIRPDGSATGTVEVRVDGQFAVVTRGRLRDMPADRADEMVRNVIRQFGFDGSGKLGGDDPKPLRGDFSYSVTLDLKKYIVPGAPGAAYVSPVFASEAPIYAFAQAAGYPEATEEIACVGGHSVEEYLIEFPKTVKVIAVPKDADIRKPGFRYRAVHKRKGSTVTVRRTIDDETVGHVCTVAQANASRAFAMEVADHLRGQVVFR